MYVRHLLDPQCLTPHFQVRGIPGRGKTTLMKLLHAHILSQDPGAVVEVRVSLTTHHDDASDSMYPPIGLLFS